MKFAQPQFFNSLATGHKVDGSDDITQILLKWSDGDNAALEELLPLVKDESRRLAVRHLRHERANHTLQPTALVNEALERLATFDLQKSRIVELRFFGGLSINEIAEVLKIGHATVERDWKLARAWLRRELE